MVKENTLNAYSHWVNVILKEKKEGAFFVRKEENGNQKFFAGIASEKEKADMTFFATDFLGEKRVELPCKKLKIPKGKAKEIWRDFPVIDLPENLEKLSNETEESFKEKVEYVKNHARNGETWVLNLTHFLSGDLPSFLSFFRFYGQFLSLGKIHAGGIFWTKNLCFASFSPELFVDYAEGKITTKPIKGTGDLDYLKTSDKEKSELMMVTDLLRNDLGKIAKNVVMKKERAYFSLGKFHHAYAEIEAEVKKFDEEKYAKLLPAGSVSGCPKHRALSIIKKLEKEERGFYSGTFGVKTKNEICSGILIRTIFAEGKKWKYGTGGGITHKSNAQAEWKETLAKAEILRSINK